MTIVRNNGIAVKVLDNVIFLTDFFGDKADAGIPKIPVLEMAQCFDLAPSPAHRRYRQRRSWPLWK
jgi:hypothetical protein